VADRCRDGQVHVASLEVEICSRLLTRSILLVEVFLSPVDITLAELDPITATLDLGISATDELLIPARPQPDTVAVR
jgi:hypothetical protein